MDDSILYTCHYFAEMEVQIHENAEWKKIQQKTFTRWCNEQLKLREIVIEDLATDLSDGVSLIALIEILSGKKLGRFNKKPRIHAQKMENVELCLNYIITKEKVRLVNIGSGDIVGSNIKLILGLVWMLILHFQISGVRVDGDVKGKSKKVTPKQALLGYVQHKIPHKDIKNFTGDWNDGTAVAALVDSIAPGLCPDADIMEPKNALRNATEAMKLAEDWLGVPMVLQPEDMVNPKVDELSMMTYVSQFPDAKLKPGAPIKPKSDASKIRVLGPGIEEEGVKMGMPVMFYVDTQETSHGKLDAFITSIDDEIEVRVEDKKDGGTYTCSYVPPCDGLIQVHVLWDNKHVNNSPFNVNVSPITNALACRAYGPGVEGGNLKEDDIVNFNVETKGAGPGDLGISIKGPKGSLECEINHEDDDKFGVLYVPPSPGQYMVEVTFSDLHIKDSPFKVRVEPNRPDASKCHAEGPGIEDSLIVGEETWFTVDTGKAGKGDLVTNIRSPHGEVLVNTRKEENVTTYTYSPNESGELVVTVKYGGNHIPGSRFRVQVDPPPNASKCVATGPGLSQAGVKVGEPAHFKVKTKDAGKGDIAVRVMSPSGDVPVKSLSSSAYENDFVYVPPETGAVDVEIDFAGEPIPGSVFHVGVTDPSKVTITGPGMDGELLPANKPLKYVVDASSAGPGVLACHVQMPVTNKEEVDTDDCNPFILKRDEQDVYDLLYTPKDVGLQKMKVSFDDAPIPKTPIRLNIFDASKVIANGPGLEDGNKTAELTHFTVDLKQAGEGNLHVDIAGPSEVTLSLKDQANDMIYAEYTPNVPGQYAIKIELQGVPIVGSPFEVNVKPRTDPSAVKAYGMGIESTDLTTGMMADFNVDFTEGGEGEVQVRIQGPAGGVEYKEEIISEGVAKYSYLTDPDESGYYNIDVCFADQHIPNSPFQIPVKWKSDPNRVIAEGAGLQGGITKEWAEFNLDLRKAGEGGVNVNIHGPDKVEVTYENHEDGTMTVKYFPNDPGDYQIDIQFNGEHIPGSVFSPVFYPCTDATKCFAFGPGLNKNGIRVGDPGNFVIDTSEGGKGAVDVIVNGPIGGSAGNNRRGSTPAAKPIITNNQDGTYSVVYNPRKVGVYNISVVFGDEEIPDSPFRVNITDPDKIILSGPGCSRDGKQENVFNSLISQPLQWTADCTEAGPGELVADVAYKKPNTTNDDDDEVTTEKISTSFDKGIYQLNFIPEDPLLYQLNILYSGSAVSDTPIVSVLDPSKVKIFGPALDGVNVDETASFTIDTTEAGTGNLSLELTGPSPGTLEKEDGKQVSLNNFSFIPTEAGTYQLNVKFGNEVIPSCPVSLPVRDISKLKVSGSGVTGANARVNAPVDVIVDTNRSGPAPISVSVSDPAGNVEPLDLSQSPNDKCVLVGSYIPSEPGHYEVAVSFNDEETDMSPYRVPIAQPENVILEGKGLERAFVGDLNVIDCFTDKAGPGAITAEVECVSSNNSLPTQVDIVEIDDNHYQIQYKIESPGLYAINVLYNGFPVEDEPKTVPGFDLSKCSITGNALGDDLLVNMPTQFTVDTRDAGKGSLQVIVQDPNEEKLSTKVTELEEGVYEVICTPTEAGGHVVNVLFEDKDVDQSPILISVVDPSQVICTGPGLSHAIVNNPAEFSIDTSKAGDSSLNIQVIGPEEVEKLECNENPKASSSYDVVYFAKKAGLYQVHVFFAGQDVPGSPFEVDCQRPPPDASKCKAIDLDKPYNFTVDCSEGGGTGLLEVGVCGSYIPADLISVHHNGDYTFNVSYKISEPGKTTISVKWHGQHLTGSPFIVDID